MIRAQAKGAEQREHDRAQLGESRPARQPDHAKRVELVSRLRNEPGFDAILRPGEGHGCSAFAQRLGDGEGGQDVSRGPPGRDEAPKLAVRRHRPSRC